MATLPTSTIVMALVTCVPFGLAIRDTINGPSRRPRPEPVDAHESESRYERDREDRQARFERAEAEARGRQWKKLYGVNVASLGGAFDGLWWDMPERQISRALAGSLGRFQRAAGIEVQLDAEPHLISIEVSPNTPTSDEDDERCRELRADLEAAWGAGRVTDEGGHVWFNPDVRTRATFSPGCTLRFEQAVTLDTWLDATPASVVPVWAVGQPLARLQQVLGERGTLEDYESYTELGWRAPGLDVATGGTNITAIAVKGKVTALVVLAGTADDTAAELTTKLTGLHGAPREEDDTLQWNKARPPIKLSDDGTSLTLTVGTAPAE